MNEAKFSVFFLLVGICPVGNQAQVKEKLKIIWTAEAIPGAKRKTLSQRIGIPYSTLNTILSKKEEIKDVLTDVGLSSTKRKPLQEGRIFELEKSLNCCFSLSVRLTFP